MKWGWLRVKYRVWLRGKVNARFDGQGQGKGKAKGKGKGKGKVQGQGYEPV